MAQELAGLTDPATYAQEPDEAWKRLKVRSRDPRFLAVVQALAAWRERTAQERDLPRNRIIRDDLLLEVAANRPGTADELARLRWVSLDRRAAAGAVEAVRAALALPQAELPEVEPPARDAARARADPRSLARAAQAQVRGAPRRAAAGRERQRPRGDRGRGRAGGRRA